MPTIVLRLFRAVFVKDADCEADRDADCDALFGGGLGAPCTPFWSCQTQKQPLPERIASCIARAGALTLAMQLAMRSGRGCFEAKGGGVSLKTPRFEAKGG